MKVGARVLGASALLLGAVGLVWADFAAVWQPVPQGLEGQAAAAYAVAALFFGCGLALQFGRSRPAGAIVLILLFTFFAVMWLPRVAAHPLIFATYSGVAEQLACALGAVCVYAGAQTAGARRATMGAIARVGFGVCAVAFGFNHFFNLAETAGMTPKWLPPGPLAWAWATGAFHVLGGLALIANIRALLAARLLTAMFAGFGLLVWLPILLGKPGDHLAWCGNAINLILVGAAWALADQLADRGIRKRVPAVGLERSR